MLSEIPKDYVFRLTQRDMIRKAKCVAVFDYVHQVVKVGSTSDEAEAERQVSVYRFTVVKELVARVDTVV